MKTKTKGVLSAESVTLAGSTPVKTRVDESSSSLNKTAYIDSSQHGNVTLELNTKILPVLYSALHEEYGQEREGIHVSDLIYCPRKTCFQKLKPLPLTNLQLNYFTSGKAIHSALQSLIKKYPDRFEIEKEVWFGDLVAHIDMFDNENNIPIEAKSARVKTMLAPKPHNLKQLEAYMSITDSDTGIILYQCLLHFDESPFVEFEHKMTKEQRIQTLHKLFIDADLLKKGLEDNDPSIVRHIAYDKEYNWLCRSCPYNAECTAMNVKYRVSDFKQ